MNKVDELIKALMKTYKINKIMVNKEEYFVYFTIFIKILILKRSRVYK